MLRLIKTALIVGILVSTEWARAGAEVPLSPVTSGVDEDSVMSIGGALTTMNQFDAIVAVPGKGKLVATANADVFCAGEETARSVIVDVHEAGSVLIDLCEHHLERRELMIRFIGE